MARAVILAPAAEDGGVLVAGDPADTDRDCWEIAQKWLRRVSPGGESWVLLCEAIDNYESAIAEKEHAL